MLFRFSSEKLEEKRIPDVDSQTTSEFSVVEEVFCGSITTSSGSARQSSYTTKTVHIKKNS